MSKNAAVSVSVDAFALPASTAAIRPSAIDILGYSIAPSSVSSLRAVIVVCIDSYLSSAILSSPQNHSVLHNRYTLNLQCPRSQPYASTLISQLPGNSSRPKCVEKPCRSQMNYVLVVHDSSEFCSLQYKTITFEDNSFPWPFFNTSPRSHHPRNPSASFTVWRFSCPSPSLPRRRLYYLPNPKNSTLQN